MNQLSRREFGALAASAPLALGSQAPGGAPQRKGDAIQPEARPFPLAQVRLLPGPLAEAQERNRQYLNWLDDGGLLHSFRVTAGLPSKAEPFAGWERPDIELRGHFTGHYLSACALMYASTGDEKLKAKADGLVAELAKCQKANGGGYLSAFPVDLFERLKEELPVWVPWYTYHKIMAGLLDMHLLAGNQQALPMVEAMAGWAKRWLDPISDEHQARMLNIEYGGMNDVLYSLSAVTGNPVYAALGRRFDHKRIFDPLAEGKDQLRGLHVNTQIPKIIGAARAYELTGEKRYRDIAEFFWRQAVEHRCYCTGGTSNYERWRTEPDRLASELSEQTQECCCTYNMLKLTRHIFSWAPDSKVGDYYERALLNGIVGTMSHQDAGTMYYVPLAPGYFKMFSTPRRSFWCCTGSGVESFSKLGDCIYFHDDRSIYVNLFIPSRLEWPEKGLRLRQETAFPAEDVTKLAVDAAKPVELALRIREPYWAAQPVTIKVNGAPVEASSEQGFRTVSRTWKAGDTVEVTLPMKLHVHAMPDDDSLQAFMYGPLVLAGQLGNENLSREMQYGQPNNARGGKFLRAFPAAVPELRATSKDLASWLRPIGGYTLAFRTSGQQRDITMSPLNELFGQRYAVYWRVRQA